MNNAFNVAQGIGNKIAAGRKEAKDENAIDSILSNAMNTQDPNQLQGAIGQILSQVSPERRGDAIKYLEGAYNRNLEAQKRQQITQAYEQAGMGGQQFLPPAVQAQNAKNLAKNQYLNQFDLGQNQNQNQNQNLDTSNQKVKLQDLPMETLQNLTGAPYKEISDPSKTIIKSREEQAKIDQKNQGLKFKSDLSRSEQVLENAQKIGEQIPQKRTALNLMKDAISNKDMSYFSRDNLAEITGIEGFRSNEGSIFKTAGKEFFLGNIGRAGARPNQWIEQQIADMMPKVGRNVDANLSVQRALENELDLDEERVRLTNQTYDDLEKKGDLSKGSLGRIVNDKMTKYATEKQDILFNDLRAIKAISEEKTQKFRPVKKGTEISNYMAQALVKQFNNDSKKAADEAKRLGYIFK